MRSSALEKKEERMQIASNYKHEGNLAYKAGFFIKADELYTQAVDTLGGRPDANGVFCSFSGDNDEDMLLAMCLSNQAQCILDMADGKGLLEDGASFRSQFDDDDDFFESFRQQALQKAQESAERACGVWADAKSIYRLGCARFGLAAQDGQPQIMNERMRICWMREAGRCFKKVTELYAAEHVLAKMAEANVWLAERGATSIPEYV